MKLSLGVYEQAIFRKAVYKILIETKMNVVHIVSRQKNAMTHKIANSVKNIYQNQEQFHKGFINY